MVLKSVGQLRFNNPVPPRSFSSIRNATRFGNACPQQLTVADNGTSPIPSALLPYIGSLLPGGQMANASEDCMSPDLTGTSFAHFYCVGLYLNVVRPAGISVGAALPVIVVSWLSVILRILISQPNAVDIRR